MLVHAFGDQRMRELEEQRPWARRQEQHAFAVDAPRLAEWTVQADRLVEPGPRRGRQRSPGRRPTTHHASGNSAPASTSLTTSPTRKGTSPLSMVCWSVKPVASASHGRPTSVDQRVADEHGRRRSGQMPVPAELRESPDGRRGNHEPDQVAARGSQHEVPGRDRRDGRDAGRVPGVHGQEQAEDQVQAASRGRRGATRAHRPTSSTASV